MNKNKAEMILFGVGKILATEEKREDMGFGLQEFFLTIVGRTKRCEEI